MQGLEEQAEETGWKLVHGDVFRAPTGRLGPMSLSVTVGTGMQVRSLQAPLLPFFVFFWVVVVGLFLLPCDRTHGRMCVRSACVGVGVGTRARLSSFSLS